MSISLADANKIIDVVFKSQSTHGFKPMAAVVLTASRTIRSSQAQDGTSLLRPKIAHGKAFGAISMGIGSRALFERAKQEPFFVQSVNALCDGALVPVPGGVLIRNQNGEVVGAVGVTGDLSDNDETCAVEAIDACGFKADTGA